MEKESEYFAVTQQNSTTQKKHNLLFPVQFEAVFAKVNTLFSNKTNSRKHRYFPRYIS